MAVLGALAVATLLVSHVTLVSGITAREARVAAARARLALAAESACERAYWLLVCDRRAYPERTLGQGTLTRPTESGEGWMTDAREHVLDQDGLPVRVALHDAAAGLDLFGANPANAFGVSWQTGDLDADSALARFVDGLSDYVDADDNRRLHGWERAEYERAGYAELPRNGILQFREELCWIAGVSDALPPRAATGTGTPPADLGAARLIPPAGLVYPRQVRPSFFAASPLLLQRLAHLDEAELAEVLAGRERWAREGITPAESISPGLLQRLNGAFSFQESGIVTLTATATTPGGVTRRREVTRDTRALRTGTPGGNWVTNWHVFLP